MTDSATVRAALVSAVKTMTGAPSPFATAFDPANVFDGLTPITGVSNLPAASYPRAILMSDGAEYEDLPGNRINKQEVFTVVAVFSVPASSVGYSGPTLHDQVFSFIDDFELLISLNKQAGGTDYIALHMCANDLGASPTEAVVVFELRALYKRQLR